MMEDCKVCPKCEAKFINGQHYWSTGKKGNPVDLASLVCRPYGDDRCINPLRSVPGGVTWEERNNNFEVSYKEIDPQ